MKNLIEKFMVGARKYSIVDFGMLKFALLFAGILLGSYFHDFFGHYIYVVWILAAVSYCWIVAVTLRKSFYNKK